MSDKNIKGNYENYEQFRLYLKEIICDCFQMGFSDKEIKEMYFDEYTKSNLVTYSYELVLLNIKYKTNNDEKTKNEIVVLAKKVENEFNKNDSTEKQATGEGQMSLVDETPEENKKLINKIIGYTKKSFSDYVSFSKEELEKLLDDEKKLKKKIDDLKKKLKKLDLEYDESKSYSDNEKIYKKAEDKKNNPSWEYPFRIYAKGGDYIQPDHVFEEGVEYTAKEIVTEMLKHGFYEFAGDVKFEYKKEENILIPNFTSQKHG